MSNQLARNNSSVAGPQIHLAGGTSGVVLHVQAILRRKDEGGWAEVVLHRLFLVAASEQTLAHSTYTCRVNSHM